jgi:protein-S-isoprenylcysteine O-methyltransferase Ste14
MGCFVALFVGNVVVPESIDLGLPPGAAGEPMVLSLPVNVLLLGLFAIQHSVMAAAGLQALVHALRRLQVLEHAGD